MPPHVRDWIKNIEALTKPKSVHIMDGSDEEEKALLNIMVKTGMAIPLNEALRPSSYLFRSSPEDVARVEERTFIAAKTKDAAGPTNNWIDPEVIKPRLLSLFDGSMKGRTLYIIPFSMGPLGSPLSRIGIQATDSPYVAVSMKVMTRTGKDVLPYIEKDHFVPCIHSVGVPLEPGVKDSVWPCNPKEKWIVHFPEEKTIYSFGSGYGGNALLGKKCFALRIASYLGNKEGWLAEHMLILGLTNPEGKKKYIAAAFPSACGKTNLAMLTPTLKNWKVETVGDDIAWMQFREGRLFAINPEAGFFGVAPGTSLTSNPSAMKTIAKNTLFTNVALTDEKDVWWEGMTPNPPPHLIDWHGNDWRNDSGKKAAHPNARFTVPAKQCPVIDPNWESKEGVPISAIIFGGRRASTIPLVSESLSWNHGVFLGASVSSETTAAADGPLGAVRHDPFAMLPFCGYNMGDYFAHWIEMGKRGDPSLLPKIYSVNWFRKNQNGQWLWPGYGENSRVLKWIFERTENKKDAFLSPIGYLPQKEDLDISGLALSQKDLEELLFVDNAAWLQEVHSLEKYFSLFGKHFPAELQKELEDLKKRLYA